MRRYLAALLLGALVLASPVAAKVVNVTTPMARDLDGGGFNIRNVGNYFTANDLAIMGGSGFQGHTLVLTDTTTTQVVGIIIGGTTDPTVAPPDSVAMPGALYVRRNGTTGELWFKTGPTPTSWSCIAGCP